MNQHFQFFSAKIMRPNKTETLIEITLVDTLDPKKTNIEFWAGAPASLGVSFSGSGLPFYNAEQAFNNSPNNGKFTPNSKQSIIRLMTPNAYYSHLGTRLIHSCVSIKITFEGVFVTELIELGEATPYRLLTYPTSRKSPAFYDRSHLTSARSQESILRSSGYPLCLSPNDCGNWVNHKTEDSFWGMAVPHS
jgi:hypothetical protein